MTTLFTKKQIAILATGGVLIVLGVIALFAFNTEEPIEEVVIEEEEVIEEPQPSYEVIGSSFEGRPIEAVTYGNGPTQLLFVGGIHGGYEWNTVVLAYQAMDYLEANPDVIPENVSVTVIPSLNPDGIYEVVGTEGRFTSEQALASTVDTALGRFNGNDVDLNRNFACKWAPESTWRGATVSAGTEAFSEPEAVALRNLVQKIQPSVVVFWHSQGNAVYASECEAGILPETITLMNAYATEAGYEAIPAFTAYPITGDAEGYLASIGIPALTVELSTHETIEWEKNRAGMQALFSYYAQ